jgi:uncharacterized protein (TIGR00369 family)
MSLEERISKSRTTLFKAVFPEMTNHHNMMHGGKAMELMDEIAFMTATRFCRKGFVTAGSIVNHKKPIPAGTLIEVVGEVVKVGKTSLKVSVKIFVEEMYTDNRFEGVDAQFTLVAIDQNKKPTLVL